MSWCAKGKTTPVWAVGGDRRRRRKAVDPELPLWMGKDGQTDKGEHESRKKGPPTCKDRGIFANMAILGNKSVNMRQANILCPTKHRE